MKYAVARINGRQYRVEEGMEILIDRLDGKAVVPEVLMISDENAVKVGTPVLDKVKINVKVLGEEKGDKVNVRKFRAKSRYRRRMGFTPLYTRVQIGKIT